MTVINMLGFRVRIRLGRVSSEIIQGKGCPSITVHRATVCFSRMQKCMSKIICRIALKTVLKSIITRTHSDMDREYP